MGKILSLLHPVNIDPEYRDLSAETIHDLALEEICSNITNLEKEKSYIWHIMQRLSGKEEVVKYRIDIFEDIMKFPELRETMIELLDKVDFLKSYGSFGKDSDTSGIWELVHRLSEVNEYIRCVEGIYDCLTKHDIQSEGLITLRDYVKNLYEDEGFAELKKDIQKLNLEASNIKSVTMGINLNDRFEPTGVGIVSINKKFFTKSNVIANFCDFLGRGDKLKEDDTWENNYTYHLDNIDVGVNPAMEQVAGMMAVRSLGIFPAGIVMPQSDGRHDNAMHMLNRTMGNMLSHTTKILKDRLSQHVAVSTYEVAGLIPEFMYYVRWAEHIEKLMKKGFVFCKPELMPTADRNMKAEGIYNLRLIKEKSEDVVLNDIAFDPEHRIYILTGANRGGKTTITQAVGIAFLLAQCGIYAPAKKFALSPADNILTHFPADENKTMDLGRLGEESKRFREIFTGADSTALFLLNESFSTTSFEEGYYIASDAIRAIRDLGARTIYNTHMHNLALNLHQFNEEKECESKVSSLTVVAKEGKRSYEVRVAPPEGLSYARDIAFKYGVTYEQLMEDK